LRNYQTVLHSSRPIVYSYQECMRDLVLVSVGAITSYHRLGGLNNNFFLTVMEARRSRLGCQCGGVLAWSPLGCLVPSHGTKGEVQGGSIYIWINFWILYSAPLVCNTSLACCVCRSPCQCHTIVMVEFPIMF
jgi:hypothetical protein